MPFCGTRINTALLCRVGRVARPSPAHWPAPGGGYVPRIRVAAGCRTVAVFLGAFTRAGALATGRRHEIAGRRSAGGAVGTSEKDAVHKTHTRAQSQRHIHNDCGAATPVAHAAAVTAVPCLCRLTAPATRHRLRRDRFSRPLALCPPSPMAAVTS